MYAEAIVEAPLSRPKIHRVPVSVMDARKKQQSRRHALFTAGFLTTITLLSYGTDRLVHSRSYEELGIVVRHETEVQPVAADNAELAPASEKQSQTIVITGENDGIVGQLARIPAQNQQITEIKTISEVDNQAARELLGIISKY
jgi:hypothetical protein